MKRDKQLICIGVAVIIFSLISIFKTLTVESKTKWYNQQYEQCMRHVHRHGVTSQERLGKRRGSR